VRKTSTLWCPLRRMALTIAFSARSASKLTFAWVPAYVISVFPLSLVLVCSVWVGGRLDNSYSYLMCRWMRAYAPRTNMHMRNCVCLCLLKEIVHLDGSSSSVACKVIV
jgi:hypothetical protein